MRAIQKTPDTSMPKQLSATQHALILYAREQGDSYQTIANKVGCGKSTVHDVFRRLEETGTTNPRKRSGRPKIFNQKSLASLKRLATKDKARRLTLRQVKIAWEKKSKKSLCADTIRQALHKTGLRSCITSKKPVLNTTHMANRLTWALEHRHWTVNQWRRVLWSDESTFSQFQRNRYHRVWRTTSEKFDISCLSATVKHSPSIMFWGCFSHKGLGPLVAMPASVTGEVHAKTLRRHAFPTIRKVFPRGNGIFQEDNARPHTSKIAAAAKEASGMQFLPWPAQSPDLNPIENLWHEVKRAVYNRHKKPKNLTELKRVVKLAWKAIPLKTIQVLVDSMPRRVEACIEAEGGPTKY
jgi:transposase